MKNNTNEEVINDVTDQEYLTNNWITSEVLIGMYSRVFTNLLLSDDRIFKGHSK
ncbi:hypothetical protein [Companilactobacillus kimchiensis]|uniref:Uncharacterized protein n=1 Tax=Companilactobacillus kimchiensis TaxID=993692 RepID=A0A0R2LFI5_9LACO|nr:hypothetical protein [Companilactobacillus kimchiensis]KRO00369.1 hypothetical protein IV57_GL001473 [Companilactobacillus kimchiensis]